MKRHSVRFITAAFAVAGLAGCFEDPTSSLRNGPTGVRFDHTAVAIVNGDSLSVEAFLLDDQGNQLPVTGVAWTTDLASVATVSVAALQLPGDASSRAFIKATAASGGVTNVRFTARGVADSIRVTSLPGVLPVGLATLTGTARPDTIGGVAYSGQDTVLLRSGPTLTFNGSSSVVRFGTDAPYVLFQSDTLFKVMARAPFRGYPTITLVTYPGNAVTGPMLLDSLVTGDNLDVARARLLGTVAVSGDTLIVTATAPAAFGANTGLKVGTDTLVVFSRTNGLQTIRALSPLLSVASYTGGVNVRRYLVNATTILDSVYSATGVTLNRAQYTGTVVVSGGILMTVTAPAGATFSTSGANTSGVRFGSLAASVISRTATQIQVSSSANYTGPVTVTNLLVGTARLDSVKTTAPSTIQKATFAGTITQTGTKLLDTITVNTPAGVAFVTGATPSDVMVGGVAAFVLSRTTTQMIVIPKVVGQLAAITNVDVGGTVFPSLVPATAVPPVTSTTGEPSELGNNALAGARAVAFTGATDTIVAYGSIDCQDDGTACPGNGDITDWYSFSLPATNFIRAILEFPGVGDAGNTAANPTNYCGNPADHSNPDIDMSIRTSTGTGVARTGGAGLVMPEISSTNAAQAPGTYTIRIDGWCTNGPMTYKLRILRF